MNRSVIDQYQAGDVERTYADLTRSKGELGYDPLVDITEGLKRFAAWFREEGEKYRLGV